MFAILTGNGQGCANRAVRSKLQLVVMQRAVHRLCIGFKFTSSRAVPALFFADDAALLAMSPVRMQCMLDVAWVMARLQRWDLRVKGITKTACMMAYWERGVQHMMWSRLTFACPMERRYRKSRWLRL